MQKIIIAIGAACLLSLPPETSHAEDEKKFQWKMAENVTIASLVAEGYELKAVQPGELYFQKNDKLFRCVDKTTLVQFLQCQIPVAPYTNSPKIRE